MVSIWICLRWRRVFQSWENLEAILENSWHFLKRCVFRSHLITKSLRLWPLAIPVVNPATFGTSPKSGGKFGNPKNTGSWEHPQQKNSASFKGAGLFLLETAIDLSFQSKEACILFKKGSLLTPRKKRFQGILYKSSFSISDIICRLYIYIYTACYHNKQLVLIGLNSGQCELGASTAFDILMGEAWRSKWCYRTPFVDETCFHVMYTV